MMLKLVVCLCLVAFIEGEKKLPKGITKCDFKAPDVNSCVAKAVTEGFRAFKDGNPSLAIPPMEPLLIPELNIQPDNNPNSPVSIGIKFKNMKIYGLSTYTVNKHTSGEGLKFFSEGITPTLKIEADYESSGKVLLLYLNGKGPCNITMENVASESFMQFSPVKKSGVTYWNVEQYKFTIKPAKLSLYFANLINTKEGGINEQLNKFLNENWSAIFDSIGPAFEEAFSTLFKDGAERVFSRVPIKNMYSNTDA